MIEPPPFGTFFLLGRSFTFATRFAVSSPGSRKKPSMAGSPLVPAIRICEATVLSASTRVKNRLTSNHIRSSLRQLSRERAYFLFERNGCWCRIRRTSTGSGILTNGGKCVEKAHARFAFPKGRRQLKGSIVKYVLTAGFLILAGSAKNQTAAQTPGSSPTSPAPVGTTLAGIIECGKGYTSHELYDMKITLLEVVRGAEAWKRIQAANPSNKSADKDFEYVLARVKFDYKARGTPGLCVHELKLDQFTAFAADGEEYKAVSVTPPKPAEGKLHSGDEVDGWVAFAVAQKDNEPIMTYSADQGAAIVHGGGKWFRLK